MHSEAPPPVRTIGRYLAILRRRALAIYGLRALAVASGALAVGLVVAGALAGPVVTPGWATFTWVCLGGLAVGLGAFTWAPAARLGGERASRLLQAHRPGLPSRVQTALEIARPHVHHSASLAQAHVAQVQQELAGIEPRHVVPASWLQHRSVGAGAVALLVSTLLWIALDGLQAGTHALLNPVTLEPDGLRTARVVSRVEARLLYPGYLEREPERLVDAASITAPKGTTVELAVYSRLPAKEGRLSVGGIDARLNLNEGALRGRFVVRRDGELSLSVRSEGEWYRDSVERRVRAMVDRVPRVEITTPQDGALVQSDRSVPVTWQAHDDVGLSQVELVMRLPSGEETRRRVWSGLEKDEPAQEVSRVSPLTAAEFGAQPGESVTLWLEARDGDVVAGPNVGMSRTLTLEIASEGQELSLQLPRLKALLDGAVDLLADRLELEVPADAQAARSRFGAIEDSTARWLNSLGALVHDVEAQAERGALDADQLRGIHDRLRKLLRRETALHAGQVRAERERRRVDTLAVEEKERDILMLQDMLAKAHVDEANAVASELKQLGERIRKLLDELRDSRDPQTQKALLSEIGRLQRRLRDLSRSLSQLATRVPSEFINREALPQQEASDALGSLREAVQSGDLESAANHLDELARQIEQMADSIDDGAMSFAQERFGARDRALSQARRKVQMIADEQSRLARRTRGVVRRANQRAAEQDSAQRSTESLKKQAHGVRNQLSDIDDEGIASFESRLLERAQDRMRDTADALETGDLSEARRMAAAASRNLEQASHSLSMDANMFPGHRGQTADGAGRARRALDELQTLRQAIQEATPNVSPNDTERRQMEQDIQAQQQARRAARSLESDIGDGVEGTPLSHDGVRTLQDVQRTMQEAERSLEQGQAEGAALAQEDAAERLRQLDEQLQRKQSGSRGSSQSSAQGKSPGSRVDGPVKIPGADDFESPAAYRRRLLDAMREDSPRGFEAPVQRYYEELLR